VTVTRMESFLPLAAVAVMVALPARRAVTTPFASTEATEESEEE